MNIYVSSTHLRLSGKPAGFTLMEVLIAITITGIALGVIMSVLAQGHRQVYTAALHRKAGEVASIIFAQVQPSWQPERLSKSGGIEEYPDWSYQIERDVTVVTDENMEFGEREFEVEELEEVRITVLPPEGEPQFVFTRYLPAEMTGQAIGPVSSGAGISSIFGGPRTGGGKSPGESQSGPQASNPFLDILRQNR